MRIGILTCLLLSLSFTVYGQEIVSGTSRISFKEVTGDEIKSYTDSLRNKHLQDTLLFSRKDLIHGMDITRNYKTNSPLYVINGKFFYKLNIIAGSQVAEFLNEVFNSGKIKVITELSPKYSGAIYGSLGSDGAILITLKKRAKFNPKIAGLTLSTDNNFDQRLPGEPIVR